MDTCKGLRDEKNIEKKSENRNVNPYKDGPAKYGIGIAPH